MAENKLLINTRQLEKEAAQAGLSGGLSIATSAGGAGEIDTVQAEEDLRRIAAETEWSDQVLEILIHPSYDENSPDHVVLAVNATNQVVFRDVPTKVKRKYVEVLARMKETRYSQHRDPVHIERSTLVPRSGLMYNFDVLFDPAGAKGAHWLRGILLEKVND